MSEAQVAMLVSWRGKVEGACFKGKGCWEEKGEGVGDKAEAMCAEVREVVRGDDLWLGPLADVETVVSVIGPSRSGRSAFLEGVVGLASGGLRGGGEREQVLARGCVKDDVGVLDVVGLDSQEGIESSEVTASLFALLGADVVVVTVWVCEVTRRDASCFALVRRAMELGLVGELFVLLRDDDGATPHHILRNIVTDAVSGVKAENVHVLAHSRYRPREHQAGLLEAMEHVRCLLRERRSGRDDDVCGTRGGNVQPERLRLAWRLARSAVDEGLASSELAAIVDTDLASRRALRLMEEKLGDVVLGSASASQQLGDLLRDASLEYVSASHRVAEARVVARQAREMEERAAQRLEAVFASHLRCVKREIVAGFSSALERQLEAQVEDRLSMLTNLLTTQARIHFDAVARDSLVSAWESRIEQCRTELTAELAMVAMDVTERAADRVVRREMAAFRREFSAVLARNHPVEDATLTYWMDVNAAARNEWLRTQRSARATLDYEKLGLQPSEVDRRVRELMASSHSAGIDECRKHCGDERAFAARLSTILRARLPSQWSISLDFPSRIRETATATGILIPLFSFVPLAAFTSSSVSAATALVPFGQNQQPPAVVEHFNAGARERLMQHLKTTAEAEGRRALFDQLNIGFDIARSVASVVVGLVNTIALLP